MLASPSSHEARQMQRLPRLRIENEGCERVKLNERKAFCHISITTLHKKVPEEGNKGVNKGCGKS